MAVEKKHSIHHSEKRVGYPVVSDENPVQVFHLGEDVLSAGVFFIIPFFFYGSLI